MRTSARQRTQFSGIVGILVVALVVWLLIAVYQKRFADVAHIDIRASRAGLMLDPGADVRAFGVKVGEVRSTRLDGDIVVIDVALDGDHVAKIPAGVPAAIEATTVFGAKYVNLLVPTGAVNVPISSGDVIDARSTTVEINDVFASTIDLLVAIRPSELQRALNSVATAFAGKGDEMGQTMEDAQDYMSALLPSLDTLESDFNRASDVTDTYSDVLPELVDTADQLSTTSRSLVARRAQFQGLLTAATDAANDASGFLKLTEPVLVEMLRALKPVSALLYAYGPQLPCNVSLLVKHVQATDLIFSKKLNAVQGYVGFIPGQQPYTYQQNAPKLVTGVGPKCYALPTKSDFYVPHIEFDDGTSGIYDDVKNDASASGGTLRGALFGATGLGKILGLNGGGQ